MRVFYSELSANPSLYSFGYSIYGELEKGDILDDCYERGFLPFVGAVEQSGKLMYMGRGTRVSVREFKERHYHARVRRKAAVQGFISSQLYPLEEFQLTNEVIDFILTYFRFRFGKNAMPEARLRALFASGFITHVREFRQNGRAVAYILEVHGERFVHTWYHAYDRALEGTHAGLYLYLELLKELQATGKEYLYLGITYGRWMAYKTNFQPLSYWNGQEWATDPKSVKLKRLFAADSLRLLTFTDAWRDERTPYYRAPYQYGSVRLELRTLLLIIEGLPRIAGVLAFGLTLLGLALLGHLVSLW